MYVWCTVTQQRSNKAINSFDAEFFFSSFSPILDIEINNTTDKWWYTHTHTQSMNSAHAADIQWFYYSIKKCIIIIFPPFFICLNVKILTFLFCLIFADFFFFLCVFSLSHICCKQLYSIWFTHSENSTFVCGAHTSHKW